MIIIIVLILNFSIMISSIAIAFATTSEIESYNKGYCPYCDEELYHSGTNFHGGRKYTCNNCGYTTWVNYKFIDKYKSEE